MKKVKRVFCAILCIAIIFSIFAISAYAVNQTFWAKSGSMGYLKVSHNVTWIGADGKTYGYPFPKYSTIRLQRDLYTYDTTALGMLTDLNTNFSFSLVEVPIYKVYIETATDSLPPDLA